MRRYIEGGEVRITVNDGLFVDVEFYGGETLKKLQPKRLFPISGLTRYIVLLDADGVDRAIIRNVDDLMSESKAAILHCLDEYYRIPKIQRLIERTEKFDIWMWTAETDRGVYTFEIIDVFNSVFRLYDGRILIKDGNDNRYEIPNFDLLDKRSQRMLMPEL